MTIIMDQFMREYSNNLLSLKIANFDTRIKIKHFQAFQEFVIFEQKMELCHTVYLTIFRNLENVSDISERFQNFNFFSNQDSHHSRTCKHILSNKKQRYKAQLTSS